MVGSKREGIAAVVGEDLGHGFSLAGVEVLPANHPGRAMELLTEEVGRGRFGILIVDETLLEGVDQRARDALFERPVPLVIAIPGTMRWHDAEQASSDEFVARLIRRAVGYQLNIQL